MLLVLFLILLILNIVAATVGIISCRRIARHLAGNAEAVKAVVDHVLLPMFGRAPKAEAVAKAVRVYARGNKATWV